MANLTNSFCRASWLDWALARSLSASEARESTCRTNSPVSPTTGVREGVPTVPLLGLLRGVASCLRPMRFRISSKRSCAAFVYKFGKMSTRRRGMNKRSNMNHWDIWLWSSRSFVRRCRSRIRVVIRLWNSHLQSIRGL